MVGSGERYHELPCMLVHSADLKIKNHCHKKFVSLISFEIKKSVKNSACWVNFHDFCHLQTFFNYNFFKKKKIQDTVIVANN